MSAKIAALLDEKIQGVTIPFVKGEATEDRAGISGVDFGKLPRVIR